MCSSGIHPYSMQSHYLGTISPGNASRPPGDVCSGPALLAGAGRRYWGTRPSLSRLPLLLLASGSVGAVGGEHRGMRDEAVGETVSRPHEPRSPGWASLYAEEKGAECSVCSRMWRKHVDATVMKILV